MARDEIDLLIEKREAAIDAERAQQYAEMALDEFDALLEEHERAIDAERAQQHEELARDEMRHGDTSCAQGIVSSGHWWQQRCQTKEAEREAARRTNWASHFHAGGCGTVLNACRR